MNKVQKHYLEVNPKFKIFKGQREIVLKARQMGISTLISAKILIETINNAYTNSVFIAQNEDNSKRIFNNMIRFYVENLPPMKKLKIMTDNQSEIVFENDSSIFVSWAGSKKTGRGSTIHNLHCSEMAYFDDPLSIVSGIFQSVPIDGNIFIESTANGQGNYFYNEFDSAIKKESNYTARFFPWFLDDMYALDVPDEFHFSEKLKILQKLYSLNDRQVYWYQWKENEFKSINNNALYTGNVKLMSQEYPSNYLEAFISSGDSLFDIDIIENEIFPNIKPRLNIDLSRKYINLIPHKNKLQIFEKPLPGYKYIITGDPSEGIKDSKSDADFSSSDVICLETYEQVAHFHDRVNPSDFGKILNDLGRYYNDGMIIIERNNHGHTTIHVLEQEFEYPNMFKYGENRQVRKTGFPTNLKTKNQAVGSLITLIKDSSLRINSLLTITELKNFCRLPGRKLGAITGHDDCVMSLALGGYILTDKLAMENARSSNKIYKTIPVKKVKGYV